MPNQITFDDIQANLAVLQGRIEHPQQGQDQTVALAITTCAQALAAIVERLDKLDATAKSIDKFADTFQSTMIMLDNG